MSTRDILSFSRQIVMKFAQQSVFCLFRHLGVVWFVVWAPCKNKEKTFNFSLLEIVAAQNNTVVQLLQLIIWRFYYFFCFCFRFFQPHHLTLHLSILVNDGLIYTQWEATATERNDCFEKEKAATLSHTLKHTDTLK